METIRPQPPHSLNNKTALFFQKFYSFRKNVHCNKETSNKEKLLKRDHRRCNHLRCIRRGKILGATKEWNLSEIEVFFQLFFRIIDYFWEKFDFCFIIKFSSEGGAQSGACGMFSTWGVVDFFIGLLFQFLPGNIDIELWWVISYKCLTVLGWDP